MTFSCQLSLAHRRAGVSGRHDPCRRSGSGCRRGAAAILAELDTQVFVAPDNGVLSHLLERRDEGGCDILVAQQYWRHPVSRSFQGRDIFAPVAGHLALGVEPARFGPEVGDPVQLEIPRPRREPAGRIHGAVVWWGPLRQLPH